MKRYSLCMYVAAIAGCITFVTAAQSGDKTPAERGRDVMRGRSLNPPVWSMKAYDDVWRQWGVAEKPTDYARAFRERYGMHVAPFDNKGLPMGLMESQGLLSKGIVNNCLLCHAGSVAGQTVIGLANSALDLESLFTELSIADGFKTQFPFHFSVARGTFDPVNSLIFLLQFRDDELNVRKPISLSYGGDLCSDPPAWWLIKRKKTRDWTGSIDARSTRVDMVNLLSPLNTADYIKKQESAFADIAAFLLTVEAPKYPFHVDEKRAAIGRELFSDNCAKCHGTNGPGGTYPDKIVALEKLGTDPALAEALTPKLSEIMNKSWLAREIGPDGKPFRLIENAGYQAPPLDGIWATAPYFHNSSAPTVYHVLNSKVRPKIYTRSYRTEKEDYDPVMLGLRITVLEQSGESKLAGFERRKIYDTTQPGRHNTGHTYGDKLSDDERFAIIEYLKTL